MKEEEADLSFLDFSGTQRHPRGTEVRAVAATRTPRRTIPRRGVRKPGARDRARTGDPHVGNVALYQLSYSCVNSNLYV